MNEVGKKPNDIQLHLWNYIGDQSPDIVYSFGELISYTSHQLYDSNIKTRHFKKFSEMIKDIKLNLIKGDAIYFKASRSLEFEKIINTIWYTIYTLSLI